MRRDDWLLAQLPVGMVEDEFFVRFVSIFQDVATTLLEGADNMDYVADVTVAPDPMVRWLGTWIGSDAIDPALPVEAQRRRVRIAARTLAWRGTRRGLVEFAELLSGHPVVVRDTGGVYSEGRAPRDPSRVIVTVHSTGGMPDADFAHLLRDEIPAHVYAEIFVGPRRIWPETDFIVDLEASLDLEATR